MVVRWRRQYLYAPLWVIYGLALFLNLWLGTYSGLPLIGAFVSVCLLWTGYILLRRRTKSASQRSCWLSALAGLLAVPLYVLAAFMFGASLPG